MLGAAVFLGLACLVILSISRAAAQRAERLRDADEGARRFQERAALQREESDRQFKISELRGSLVLLRDRAMSHISEVAANEEMVQLWAESLARAKAAGDLAGTARYEEKLRSARESLERAKRSRDETDAAIRQATKAIEDLTSR